MAKLKEETLKLNILINGDASRKALLDQERAITANVEQLKKLQKQYDKLKSQPISNQRAVAMYDLNKKIKEVNATLTEQKKKFSELQKTVPLTSKTISELKKEAAMLRIALNKAVPGTENYKKLNADLVKTKERLKELTDQSKATGNTLSAMAGKLSHLTIVAAGAAATVGKIKSSVDQATGAFMEQDEAMTDAMKTTNLTKEEMAGLNEQLKKIDTRTAQNELLSLVRIGGKLGVTGTDNLLGFARAADQINVALKEDLGGDAEGAIAAIGKMVDIFQLEGRYGLEQSILKVGSAVNELGMASTANEGYIVDFTKRLAGIAPNADISIDKVLGLAATLDKYGQASEMSSTAIGQTIMAMFKRTETFAGIAKMSLQEFTDLLNTDVNEAFIRVLEGISGDNGGLASITKAMEEMHLSGARASQVLGTLSKNTDELRNQQILANQAFQQGTSLTAEFAVKNNSSAAAVEKHQKALRDTVVELGERLMPVAEGFMDLSQFSMNLLLQVVNAVDKYKGSLVALSATVVAATSTQKIYNAVKMGLSKVISTVIALRRTDTATLRTHMATMKGASAATALLSAAKFALVGNLKMATVSMRAFNAAVKANPLGVLLTAVTAVATAFTFFRDKARQAKEAQQQQIEANRKLKTSFADARIEIERQRTELERLKTAAMAAKRGTKERAEAIASLNEKLKDYNIALDAEKSSNNDIAVAMQSVNKELEKRIYLTAMENDLQSLATGFADSVKETLGLFKDYFGKDGDQYIKDMTDAIMEYKAAAESGGDLTAAKAKMTGIVSGYVQAEKMGGINKTAENSPWGQESISSARSNLIATAEAPGRSIIDGIITAIGNYVAEGASIKSLYAGLSGGAASTTGGTTTTTSGGSSSGSWAVGSDPSAQGQILEAKRKYLRGEIASREALNEEILKIEIKAIEDRLALGISSGEEEMKLQQQLTDKKIQLKKSGEKQVTSTAIAEEHNRMDALDSALADVETKYQAERFRRLQAQAQEVADFEGSSTQLKALKRKHQEELAQMDMDRLGDLKKILEDLLSTNKAIIAGEDFDLGEAILSDEEYVKLMKKLQDIIKKMNGGASGDGGAFSGTGGGELFGVSQAQWQQFFDNIEQGKFGAQELGTVISAIGDISNQAMNIASRAIDKTNAKEQKDLKQFEKANNKKKQAVKDRLAAGLISEGQHDAEVYRLDQEYADKEEEMKLKQAKREKAMNLTQAIINTALGVTMTLAQWGIPWGLIPAGIMAAMGAAEVGLIASTPVTTGAEKGGKIFTRREQDNKTFKASLSPDARGFIDSPTVLVGENGSEYVIPHEAIENPTLAPFLATMEMARRNGQLKSIDFRSVFPTTVNGRVAGGYIASAATSPVEISTDNGNLAAILEDISKKLDNPMVAQVALLGEKGLLKKMDQYKKLKQSNGTING